MRKTVPRPDGERSSIEYPSLSEQQLQVYRAEYLVCASSRVGLIKEIKAEYGFTGAPAEVIRQMESQSYRPHLARFAIQGCWDGRLGRLPRPR